MLVIGLTGGIGSGKTAVSDLFESLGITVVDADLASRVVVEQGKPALKQIASHFGAETLNADGSLNRAKLREKVFADPMERQWLEQLLHPLIGKEIASQIDASQSPYTLLVSPILFETGQSRLCQRYLVVDASEESQLTRTMARDQNSAEQVKSIMAAQMQRSQRLEQADDIIENNGSLTDLSQKVQALHQTYLQMATN